MDNKTLKIEIIIQTIYLDKLLDFLEDRLIRGFSAFEIDRGKGTKRGEHMVEGLLPTSRWTYMFSITQESTYQVMREDLCAFLDKFKGALVVTLVYDSYHIGIH